MRAAFQLRWCGLPPYQLLLNWSILLIHEHTAKPPSFKIQLFKNIFTHGCVYNCEDVSGDTYGGQKDLRSLGPGVTDSCETPFPTASRPHKITFLTCFFLLVSGSHSLFLPQEVNNIYCLHFLCKLPHLLSLGQHEPASI